MTSDRVLITGATGFVGSAVVQYWAEQRPDVEVWGTSDRPCPRWMSPSRYRQIDLRDAEAVLSLVDESRPTAVVHLASVIAGVDLETYLSVNVVGTDRLYGALAGVCDEPPRVVQIGSAAMYGRVSGDDLPIHEDQPFRPVTEYAVSKVAQEYVAIASGYSRGLPIVRARVFNLLGPGQPEHLVPMTFACQLAAVAEGSTESIRAGLITARRDFVDVRDAARAFDLLLGSGVPGEVYNVGSGSDASVEELIRILIEVSGVEARIDVDEDRLRPVDVPRVLADISKIHEATGWEPRVGLRRSLEDMWREVACES